MSQSTKALASGSELFSVAGAHPPNNVHRLQTVRLVQITDVFCNLVGLTLTHKNKAKTGT